MMIPTGLSRLILFMFIIVRNSCKAVPLQVDCGDSCKEVASPNDPVEILFDDVASTELDSSLSNSSDGDQATADINNLRGSTANDELAISITSEEVQENLFASQSTIANLTCTRTTCCDTFIPNYLFELDANGLLRLTFSNVTFTPQQYDSNERGAVVCYPNSDDFVQCLKWLLEPGEVEFRPDTLSLYQQIREKEYELGQYVFDAQRNGYWVCIPHSAIENATITESMDVLQNSTKFSQNMGDLTPATALFLPNSNVSEARDQNLTSLQSPRMKNSTRCDKTACCDVFIPNSAFQFEAKNVLQLQFSNITFAPQQYVNNGTGAIVCYPNSANFMQCPKWLLDANEVELSSTTMSLYQNIGGKTYRLGEYNYDFRYNGYWVCVPTTALENAQLIEKTSIYYLIGYFLSEICLMILFVARLRSKDPHNIAFLNCIAALFIAFMLLIIRYMSNLTSSRGMCIMVGLLSQFSFLAYFCWLNILAFMSLKPRIKTGGQLKRFIKQSLYGWGVPLIITMIALSRDFEDTKHKPNFATSCWLNDFYMELAFFHLPIGIILIINCITFLLSLCKDRNQDQEEIDPQENNYTLPLKLAVVLGFLWIFEIVSWTQGDERKYWLAFDLINSLQGVLLLICMLILGKRFRKKQSEKLFTNPTQQVLYKTSLPANEDIKLNPN